MTNLLETFKSWIDSTKRSLFGFRIDNAFSLRLLAKKGYLVMEDGSRRPLSIVDAEIVLERIYEERRGQKGVKKHFYDLGDFVNNCLGIAGLELMREVHDELRTRDFDPSENDVDYITPWEDKIREEEDGWKDF